MGGNGAELPFILGGVADTIVHPKVPSFFFVHIFTFLFSILWQVVVVELVAPSSLLSILPGAVGAVALNPTDILSAVDDVLCVAILLHAVDDVNVGGGGDDGVLGWAVLLFKAGMV